MKKTILFVMAAGLIVGQVFAQSPNDFTIRTKSFGGVLGVVIMGYKGHASDVVIPASINGIPVMEIGDQAFMLSNLTSVVLPRTVVRIGKKAFFGNSIRSVSVPESVREIGDNAFDINLRIAVIERQQQSAAPVPAAQTNIYPVEQRQKQTPAPVAVQLAPAPIQSTSVKTMPAPQQQAQQAAAQQAAAEQQAQQAAAQQAAAQQAAQQAAAQQAAAQQATTQQQAQQAAAQQAAAQQAPVLAQSAPQPPPPHNGKRFDRNDYPPYQYRDVPNEADHTFPGEIVLPQEERVFPGEVRIIPADNPGNRTSGRVPTQQSGELTRLPPGGDAQNTQRYAKAPAPLPTTDSKYSAVVPDKEEKDIKVGVTETVPAAVAVNTEEYRLTTDNRGVITLADYLGTSRNVIVPTKVGNVTPVVIGKLAYWNRYLVGVKIPETIVRIEDSAFSSNTLTEVVIPDSVRYIGYQAFNGNPLQKITIGEAVPMQIDSFPGLFADFYRINGMVGGTYYYSYGRWFVDR
ncbi:MAG: leucine-rich repeat domain-containing protein [Spirochaetaceae bacterium]|jgi:hypothetical protein|nr:leucine-rich repeat domain-containing protein [Spirochaetaceae bacterium]